jgi:hypothetical protein
MELISSFGPLGRHKIVSNGAGTILITKDGHNVVPTSNEGGRKTFEQIARSCRITASSRRGDGFLTSEIITRTLLDSTLQGLQELHAPKWRIRYLAAAVAIRSVIQSMQHEIQKCFINMRLWHVEQDCSRRMRALCYTMSFPASNAATAEVLDSILVKHLTMSVNTLILPLTQSSQLYRPAGEVGAERYDRAGAGTRRVPHNPQHI